MHQKSSQKKRNLRSQKESEGLKLQILMEIQGTQQTPTRIYKSC
ncbi:unnamed protein product [Timema podura]|uniref:Uncharacterized protein n=1 Tax=Timema podura TaxID=61482 RepID=A0ABN7PA66_TIMPD|nr:unnamed protein product [Timema podura]